MSPATPPRNASGPSRAHRAMWRPRSRSSSATKGSRSAWTAHRCGGAFRIAPDARIDDAALDVVVVDDLPGLARLPVLLRALRGAHLTHAAVTHQRTARVTLTFPAAPLIEADGELRQAASAMVEVASVPAALRLVAD